MRTPDNSLPAALAGSCQWSQLLAFAHLAARAHICADARAPDLAPTIAELQAAGATSLRAIAVGLNERRIPTARGGDWSPTQVMRVLARKVSV
jgi:hypothetical protein